MFLTSTTGVWCIIFQLCLLVSLTNAEDFYKLLGIARKATKKEIKKAYRQKSLEFHPDKNKAEGAADKFGQINRAYEALMDEETRSIYDRQGEEGLKQHEARQAGGGGGGGFDPFEQFFGGGFGGGRQRREQELRTPNVNIPLELTLEQMYSGATFEISYIRQVLCMKWEMCMKNAPDCQGPGIRVRRQQIAPGFVQQVQQRDDKCVARGKMWSPNCSECKSQTEQEKIELTVDASKGIRSGEAITFEDVADEKPGYKAGDLNFVVMEKDHPVYHREGDNLYMNKSIPLVDALVSNIILFISKGELILDLPRAILFRD
jgi:DnaJ-class molecular chaperone